MSSSNNGNARVGWESPNEERNRNSIPSPNQTREIPEQWISPNGDGNRRGSIPSPSISNETNEEETQAAVLVNSPDALSNLAFQAAATTPGNDPNTDASQGNVDASTLDTVVNDEENSGNAAVLSTIETSVRVEEGVARSETTTQCLPEVEESSTIEPNPTTADTTTTTTTNDADKISFDPYSPNPTPGDAKNADYLSDDLESVADDSPTAASDVSLGTSSSPSGLSQLPSFGKSGASVPRPSLDARPSIVSDTIESKSKQVQSPNPSRNKTGEAVEDDRMLEDNRDSTTGGTGGETTNFYGSREEGGGGGEILAAPNQEVQHDANETSVNQGFASGMAGNAKQADPHYHSPSRQSHGGDNGPTLLGQMTGEEDLLGLDNNSPSRQSYGRGDDPTLVEQLTGVGDILGLGQESNGVRLAAEDNGLIDENLEEEKEEDNEEVVAGESEEEEEKETEQGEEEAEAEDDFVQDAEEEKEQEDEDAEDGQSSALASRGSEQSDDEATEPPQALVMEIQDDAAPVNENSASLLRPKDQKRLERYRKDAEGGKGGDVVEVEFEENGRVKDSEEFHAIAGLAKFSLPSKDHKVIQKFCRGIETAAKDRMVTWAGTGSESSALRALGFPSQARMGALREAGVDIRDFYLNEREAESDRTANETACIVLGEETWNDQVKDTVELLITRLKNALPEQDDTFDMAELIAVQPTLHNGMPFLKSHLNFPLHDGFGKVIVTAAVSGSATVLLYGPENKETQENEGAWRFQLEQGEVYCLSGLARTNCVQAVYSEKHPYRKALDFRFGLFSKEEIKQETWWEEKVKSSL